MLCAVHYWDHCCPIVVGPRIETDDGMETPKYGEADFNKSQDALPKPDDGTEQLQEFSKHVCIILHTVNEYETQAVLNKMDPPDIKPHFERPVKHHSGTSVLGMFGGYRAALIQTKMGSECREEIEGALHRFPNAHAVLAIGVAWGRTKYKLGDVLVSKHIHGVKNVKFPSDDKLVIRPSNISVVEISDDLMRIFTRETKKWSFKCSKEDRNAQAYCGGIVSPPWLVTCRSMRDKMLEVFPEAIGGEMEGSILVEIQHHVNKKEGRKIGVIIIKGVADYADEDKQDGKKWQFTAAMSAACYAKHQLLEKPGKFSINITMQLLRMILPISNQTDKCFVFQLLHPCICRSIIAKLRVTTVNSLLGACQCTIL